jgi:uncharacterized glyoxalase superfamily protein PhnB
MAATQPLGSPQFVPYLYYHDADAAIDFLQEALGFRLEHALRNPQDGKLLTSKLSFGSGAVFVGPGMGPFGTAGTADPDAVSCMIYVYVDDVDAHYRRAVAAGAHIRSEPQVQFGGNRQYTMSDPGGHRWTFAQPVAEGAR